MANTKKRSSADEVDLKDLVKTDEHEQDINHLSTRLATLEEKFGNNEKIAETFCKTVETQKPLDELLRASIRSLLSTDHQTIESLKKAQRIVNDEDWKTFVKKIGGWTWSLLLIAIGAIFTALIKKLTQ